MSDLTNIWPHSDCLSHEQLMQYIQQTLKKDEMYLVESHLNDCPMCSDALDGLMQADLMLTENHLKEIKVELEQKWAVSASTHTSKINKNGEDLKTKETLLKPQKGLKFKWLYAASILLFVGLGYSVFSFIKKMAVQKHDLAKSSETPTLSSNEEELMWRLDKEIEVLRMNEEEARRLKNIRLEERNYKQIQSRKNTSTEKTANKQTEFSQDRLADEELLKENKPNAPVEASAPIAKEVPTYTDESMRNYAREERLDKQANKKAIADKKTSGYGSSKDDEKPSLQSPTSNQQNYSSTNEKTPATNQEVKDILAIATAQYNNGNYNKTIEQLEKILAQSTGEEREDILYYLAMSHFKLDHYSSAKTYFKILSNTTRYKKQAIQYLDIIN